MITRTFMAGALATLASSCASTAPTSAPIVAATEYRAPWADYGKPVFRDLLVSYGAANLATQREATLDRYLRSQSKTYDRYVAAREVGVGVEPLQHEAIAEIQAHAPALQSKQFVVRTHFTVYAYDQQLGGFPVYQEPFDEKGGLRYTNEDVRSGRSAAVRSQGMSVVSRDQGFNGAEVWFSKLGWVIPSTPDQAIRSLERLSQVGGERKVAVAMTYTLDRCDASDIDSSQLMCKATIRAIYGYDGLDEVRTGIEPSVVLVRRAPR